MIINIPANYFFIKSLTKWVYDKFSADLVVFANITILMPNKRSCKELSAAIYEYSGKKTTIIPIIKSIDDIGYGDISSESHFEYLVDYHQTKYQILLLKKVEEFIKRENFFKYGNTNYVVEIASKLDELLNDINKNKMEIEDFTVDMPESSIYIEEILAILRKFFLSWNDTCKDNNIININQYRNYISRFYCQRLTNNSTKFPVIAAGSTGSIKSTLEILKVVHKIPNGYLFLYNLDKVMNEKIWMEITEIHPQFSLKNLVNSLSVNREEIYDLKYEEFVKSDRQKFISNLMLPIENIDAWKEKIPIESVNIIEAKNRYEEAKIISLICKSQLLKNPDKSIAIISNDREMQFYTKSSLEKFGIHADYTSEMSLLETKIGSFFIQIAELFMVKNFAQVKIIDILSIVKNPLFMLGDENVKLQLITEIDEFIKQNNMFYISDFLNIKKFPSLNDIAKSVAEIKKQNSFDKVAVLHFELVKSLIHTQNNVDFFYDFEIFIKEIVDSGLYDLNIDGYVGIIRLLLSKRQIFATKNFTNCNIKILSTIEARLLDYDVVIVSNMNDEEFPKTIKSDFWFNNEIRDIIGLTKNETYFGLAAFDFTSYLAAKEVYLTRSIKNGNTRTVKSKFITKMEAMVYRSGFDARSMYNYDYNKYLEFTYKKPMQIAQKSAYSPPLEARPRVISVSGVRKLINNPYNFYLEYVLKLRERDFYQRNYNAEFGSFLHKVLEEYMKEYSINPCFKNSDFDNKLAFIAKIGHQYFEKYFKDHKSQFWWNRFNKLAKYFVYKQNLVEGRNVEFRIEEENFVEIENIKFIARFDRIDIADDGKIFIVDYKTGAAPSAKDVESWKEPQMAIEAFIVNSNQGADSIILEFWTFPSGQEVTIKSIDVQASKILDNTKKNLNRIIDKFYGENYIGYEEY